MTLLKDLIDIPDRVARGDFVLKLTEGVQAPAETLREYVVTPELVKCFDAALTIIRNAVQGRTSKATFLHGSFGSGKSHFMAVLHLILQGNTAARGIPELAAVIQKHNDWLAGKKFLLVPFHVLGAHDSEAGILGRYVSFIRERHPEAPIPPVYMSAAIIEQARRERDSYGDELFFRRLNAGRSTGDSGWGELEAAWDASSFDEAAAAPPDSEDHLRLVSALLETVATSHAEVISSRGGTFVRFDEGLSIISRHAANLGYDALLLFLDELILWLSQNSADLAFVKREAAKLTNLVEAQSADRPIPIASFVARQRDLRELIGDHVPGAEKLSFGDSLDWQQGRFDTIKLEDRNLPAIAEKRVLKCKSEAARAELDAAFEKTARVRDSVMNILLTREGDRQMFRQVYPFSPALVQTLIAVSSVLQRERTALKVMMQLLVDQRDTLQVGDLVPVGDLFDCIAHGDEAFSQEMAIHFNNALRLYHQKLLPMLEKQHGVRREDIEQRAYGDPARTAFRNDDRLIKTLLLSALVPEVESLRGLNAEKLAALNHGTIRTPVPGREGQEVLRRCRSWAASVGDIRIGEETNPTISVQLSGVDTESIIEQARREDNQGNRIRRVRQMLFEQVGIRGEGEFQQYHEFRWRNTHRACNVIFKNIRELRETSLENTESDWKLVIDFPFDEAGHGPRDDLSTLQRFRETHPQGAKTLCWVPSFFSSEAQKDLGMLVILEHILTGERFGQYSNHLSPQDRQAAKTSLESQRSQLQQRVQNHLDAAYGLEPLMEGSLDPTRSLDLNEQFMSLEHGFFPRPPSAGNLAGAMQDLLSQALENEFPAAPHFETEVKTSVLKKVYEQVAPAAQVADGRLAIDRPQRALLRQVANLLLVGEMGPDATHFVLGQHWKTHFTRKAAETGSPLSVGKLRDWIDEPRRMGLPAEAENVIILIFAAQTNHAFYLHGGAFDATVVNLPDACELRRESLPDAEQWKAAVARAGHVFGVAGSPLASAGNVNSLASAIKARAGEVRRASQTYVTRLRERARAFDLDHETDRLRTAEATATLVNKLNAADARDVVKLLATAEISTSEAAMGECIGKAAELEGNLDTAGWQTFELVRKLPAEHQALSQEILREVRDALASDEHVVQLAPALKGAQARAMRLLESLVAKPQEPAPSIRAPAKAGLTIVDEGMQEDLTLDAARDTLAAIGEKLHEGRSARINVSWIIEEGGDA